MWICLCIFILTIWCIRYHQSRTQKWNLLQFFQVSLFSFIHFTIRLPATLTLSFTIRLILWQIIIHFCQFLLENTMKLMNHICRNIVSVQGYMFQIRHVSAIFSIPCNESFSTLCFDWDAIKLKFLNSVFPTWLAEKNFAMEFMPLQEISFSFKQRTLSRTHYLFIDAATCSAPSESTPLELRSKCSNRESLLQGTPTTQGLTTSHTPSFYNIQLPRSR